MSRKRQHKIEGMDEMTPLGVSDGPVNAVETTEDVTRVVEAPHKPELTIAQEKSEVVPELNEAERREVAKRTSISVVIVHEAIREEGERELHRPPWALAISGLAAGLSMGFSLMSEGLIHAYLPPAIWTPLLSNFGYCIGFLIVVLGRQQLFTENTLTVILPLLAHPNWRTLYRIGRLWTIVLVMNLIGAFCFAAIVAHANMFPANVTGSLAEVARLSLHGDFNSTLLRGIFAGWLIALMVWLLPGAANSRPIIIIIITYIVALGGFAHIIVGSVEVLYLVNIGAATWYTYFIGFMLPTLLGNIIGGVSLVAALNFAQVAAETIGTA
jgi:formate-nitrite transporter family protein